MTQFTVWIVSPPNYPHSECFREVAEALNESLIELGHDSKITTSSFECRGRTIVLGANILALSSHFLTDLPEDLIFYNLEQIFNGSPWLTKEYIALLKGKWLGGKRKFEVWDYCQSNIDALKTLGITAKLCGIGYSPCLTRIPTDIPRDIDVLHIGSLNERRIVILNQLENTGVKVHKAFNAYGKERDDLIARSKIVLNIHFYPNKTFEIVRCSYLFANSKCVISESGNDISEEQLYTSAVFCKYEELVDRCLLLLERDDYIFPKLGFDNFSNMKQSDMLQRVLTS